ncbi:MAG: glycosyltransferase family 4 protein [Anaerolineales bacterium]|nr:glycosyltransferase family 4 protein [Anaerolineales bacterium]
MRFKVVSYCPDRHIEYDGETPYRVGVGGGVTARVRMAKVLARLGHDVQMVVNCPEERWIDGVHYRPLDSVARIQADVLILNTSGGDLDLSPALDLDLEARLRIVWAHGLPKPGGLDEIKPDYVYAVSNFIAGVVRDEWRVPDNKIFVTYNGYDEDLFTAAEAQGIERDPYRLIYFSHPSKGLETALAVLRLLRAVDERYHIEVFGGNALWGQQEQPHEEEPGARYHGLVGQRRLTEELLASSFSLQMQHREEPGALAIVDAMRAGCVIVANPVGCYPEFVQDSHTGLLISVDHREDQARKRAAEQVHAFSQCPASKFKISVQAQRSARSRNYRAEEWTAHWQSLLA